MKSKINLKHETMTTVLVRNYTDSLDSLELLKFVFPRSFCGVCLAYTYA